MARLKTYEILYEDSFLIVVNKAAGVHSISGRNSDDPSLVHQPGQQDSNLYPVYRLDRDTSGLLIIAKDEESHRVLSIQFIEGKAVITYQAIMIGRPAEEAFSLNYKLAVDAHGKAFVSGSGKVSVTHCKVVEHFSKYTLVEANPVTGRQQQIRAHLAHIGHPLAVDPLYGSRYPLTITDIKPGIKRKSVSDVQEPALMKRTPLHALNITFSHPKDNCALSFNAPMPKDMLATLAQLRKWSR